jgi:hypothetical protein
VFLTLILKGREIKNVKIIMMLGINTLWREIDIPMLTN